MPRRINHLIEARRMFIRRRCRRDEHPGRGGRCGRSGPRLRPGRRAESHLRRHPRAVAAIGAAVERAVAGCRGSKSSQWSSPWLAEERGVPTQVSERLGRLGVGRVVLQPDMWPCFISGTTELDGYGLIAGTAASRRAVRDGVLHRVVAAGAGSSATRKRLLGRAPGGRAVVSARTVRARRPR